VLILLDWVDIVEHKADLIWWGLEQLFDKFGKYILHLVSAAHDWLSNDQILGRKNLYLKGNWIILFGNSLVKPRQRIGECQKLSYFEDSCFVRYRSSCWSVVASRNPREVLEKSRFAAQSLESFTFSSEFRFPRIEDVCCCCYSLKSIFMAMLKFWTNPLFIFGICLN
jgi:hypothetical protein